MSGAELALSIGFETLSNLKRARDSLHAVAQRQRVRNALLSAPHAYAVGDRVLLSTKNILLRGASKKLSPMYVGPFEITELLGKNAVRIKPTGVFSALSDVINVEYLRPYHERSANVGPPPHHLSIKPIAVEPEGEWFKIAEILHHRGFPGPNQECLVRWEGFDDSHDSWIARKNITPKALVAYEQFLRECVASADSKAKQAKARAYLQNFIGDNERFSAIKKKPTLRCAAAETSRGEREPEQAGRDPKKDTSVAASDSAPTNEKRTRRAPLRFEPS